MTDAPDAPTTDPIDSFVSSWKSELHGQASVSAGQVQDRLLDLWSRLEDSDARPEIERWLTETLTRHLYQVDEITERLDELVPAS